MVPSTGRSVTRSMSLTVRTCTFIVSRRIACPAPSSSPSRTPRARFWATLGEVGDVGVVAGFTTVATTGSAPSGPGGESCATTTMSRSLTADAMAAASVGSPRTTDKSMVAVLVGMVAVMLPASFSGVVSRPSWSMTGCRTIGVLATFANDCAWFST